MIGIKYYPSDAKPEARGGDSRETWHDCMRCVLGISPQRLEDEKPRKMPKK